MQAGAAARWLARSRDGQAADAEEAGVSYTKAVIRCAADVTSRLPLTDLVTGFPPSFWAGTDVEFQIAFFSGRGANAVLLDMTAYSSITVRCRPKSRTGPDLFSRTVLAADITPVILLADWTAGTAQHLKVAFTALETDLPLQGANDAEFWLVITGLVTGTPDINETLAGSTLAAFEDGVA